MRIHQALLCSAILVLLISCTGQAFSNPASTTIPLRLGIQTTPIASIPIIAYSNGYFAEQGLAVDLQIFTAGTFALQTLLAGSLDVATPAEVPPTLALLQGNTGFVILAQGVQKTTNDIRVVVRDDGTATSPEEYFAAKKRKLATSFGGGPEFFTYNFLKLHNISAEHVELISQKPEDMPVALASGSVDAISIFEPYAYFAEQQTPNTKSFIDDGIYSELYVFAFSKNYLKNNPVAGEKFLRASIKAEEFIKNNPEQAKSIVSNFTKLDPKVLDAIWQRFDFAVVLTPKLAQYMQQEAVWARETGKVPATATLPPSETFIDPTVLRSIKPEAVQI